MYTHIVYTYSHIPSLCNKTSSRLVSKLVPNASCVYIWVSSDRFHTINNLPRYYFTNDYNYICYRSSVIIQDNRSGLIFKLYHCYIYGSV